MFNGYHSYLNSISDTKPIFLLIKNTIKQRNSKENVQGINSKVTTWNEWFDGSPNMSIEYSYSTSISINSNILILFCGFMNTESPVSLTDGSASDISLCIEECSFIDCYSDGQGGAILFNKGTNCVLHKICAYQCSAHSGNYGQFCYLYLKSGYQNLSIAHLISVCKCTQIENNNRYSAIYCVYMNVSVKNVNSSANRCAMNSGFYFRNPCISHTMQSTFYNNTDENSICIRFDANSHYMSQCNIIKNHQITTNYGTITTWFMAQTTLSDCVIDLSTGATNIVFANNGCTVTFMNCFLQSNMQTSGDVYVQSPKIDRKSLILSNMDSQMCFSIMHNVIVHSNTITSYNIINKPTPIYLIFVLLFFTMTF